MKTMALSSIYNSPFIPDPRIKGIAANLDKFGKKMNVPEKGSIRLGEIQGSQFASIDPPSPGREKKHEFKPSVGRNTSVGKNIELTNGSPVKNSMAKYEKYQLDMDKVYKTYANDQTYE